MVRIAVYNYLHNLIAIANSDGSISENELQFLIKKGQELGIQKEEILSYVEDAVNMHFIIPTNIMLRMKYLEDCIEMTIADGKIHPKEFALCKKICEMMGFTEDFLLEEITMRNINVIN